MIKANWIIKKLLNLLGIEPLFFMDASRVSSLKYESIASLPDSKNEEKIFFPRGYIESYGTFLPKTSISSRQTVKGVKKVKFIPLRYVTGIQKRRASQKYGALDLGFKAIEKCLARSSYRAEDIDLLVCCNICKSSDGGNVIHYEPTSAIKMKKAFGMRKAISFDINNACAGMLTGVYLVNKMIEAGAIRRAIIFSGEHISHLAQTAQREISDLRDPRLACLTLGDAGAALLIDATSDHHKGIMHFEMQTFAEHSLLCTAFASKGADGGIIMHTNSREILKHGLCNAVGLFKDKIQSNLIPFNEKSLIIPHQVSRRMPSKCVAMVNEAFEKKIIGLHQIFDNVKNVGNTASTAHFVAMAKAISGGQVKNGRDIVFISQASGLNIGILHYKMDDLPSRVRQIKKDHIQPLKAVPVTPLDSASVMERTRIMIDTLGACVEESLDTVTLAAKAARSCVTESGLSEQKIHYLMHCGLYRTDSVEEPSHAALIAGQLGLSQSVNGKFFVFDVVNGGMGWLNSVYTASFILDQDGTLLLTASECDENKRNGRGQPLNIAEMGSAALFRPSDGRAGFSHFCFRSFTVASEDYSVSLMCTGPNSHLKVVQDQQFENRLLEVTVQAFTEQLASWNMTIDQFSGFILPQRSQGFLNSLIDQLSLPNHKVVSAVKDNDLFTSSTPVAMKLFFDEHQPQPGEQILVVEVASGIQVGMAIYTCG